MVVIQLQEDMNACELKLRSSESVLAEEQQQQHASLRSTGSLHNNNTNNKRYERESTKSSFQDISFRSITSVDPFHETSLDLSTASAVDNQLLQQIQNVEDCRKLTLVRSGTRYSEVSSPYLYFCPYSFPISTLTTILRKAKRMVCVELCRLRLVGTLEEFRQLALALEGQTYLQAFSLEECRLPRRLVATTRQKALEPVVKALATCPCIGDVTLIADKPRGLGSLSPETVGFLGRSPSLQILRLEKLGLEDRHVVALSEALVTNKMLSSLWLSCNLEGDAGLVHLLQHNTTLQKLDILLESVPHDETSTMRIARALQSSSSLRHYNLDFDNIAAATKSGNIDMDFVQEVQEEVQESKALARELEFSSTSLSNCPFIRLVNRAIDAGLYVGNLACHHQHFHHHHHNNPHYHHQQLNPHQRGASTEKK